MSHYANADEIYRVAAEIERNGCAFYTAAAERVEEVAVRRLCVELAGWEARHAELFESLRSELPLQAREGAVFDPESELQAYVQAAADNHVFSRGADAAARLGACREPAEVLDVAIAFERDSVVFYTAMKKLVEAGCGRERLDTLVEEEARHIALLENEKRNLAR